MELFTHCGSVLSIVQRLTRLEYRFTIVNLIDAHHCRCVCVCAWAWARVCVSSPPPALTTAGARACVCVSVSVCVNTPIDAHHCSDASKFIAATLLSLTVMIKLELPHVNVLSKVGRGWLARRTRHTPHTPPPLRWT